jgi:CobQ-like glutamine amidotransferase family enzyme
MMHSLEADEATIRCEEEVGIRTHQTRECIKSGTIYGYENRGRETRLGEEFDPVDVVVIGHVLLNYPTPSNDSHLYTWGIVTAVSLGGHQQTTRQWRG